MVVKKKTIKSPSVIVETRKISTKDSCSASSCCGDIKHLILFILIVINTLMIAFVLFNQTKIQADQVGGKENYKMVKQIYKTDMFKEQQTTQIQQALQMYQAGAAATQPTPTIIPEETVVE